MPQVASVLAVALMPERGADFEAGLTRNLDAMDFAVVLVCLGILAAVLWYFLYSLSVHKDDYLDDAYISYIYGKHIAEGYGFRYNSGDLAPTDGATSFLHSIVVAALVKLNQDPLAGTRFLSIVALVGSWLVAAKVFCNLANVACRQSLAVAVSLLAFTALIPETTWHMATGMETILLFSTNILTALWALKVTHRGDAIRIGDGLLGAILVIIATLLRPDALVFSGALVVFTGIGILLRSGRQSGKIAISKLVPGALTVAAFLAGFAAWKAWYFGGVLPNSYWVKSNNHIFGSSAHHLPGLRPVVEYLALRLIPLSAIYLILVSLTGRHKRNVIEATWFLIPPVVLVTTAFSLTIHEAAGEFRYLFPYSAPILVAIGYVAARATKTMVADTDFLGKILIFAAMSTLLLVDRHTPVMAELSRDIKGHPARLFDWTDYVPDGRPITDAARDLKETGIGAKGTILLAAAGFVPWYSGYSAVDWIGLNDTYLSGKTPLSIDQVWSYINKKNPDVVMGFVPPASPGATSFKNDPAFRSPAIQMQLGPNGSQLYMNWDRRKISEMLWREMSWIRDKATFGACYDKGRSWVIFVFVRKDSPHARQIQDTLAKSTRAGCDRPDFDRIYYIDPRPGGTTAQ